MCVTKHMFKDLIIDELFHPTNKTNKDASMHMTAISKWIESVSLKELRDKNHTCAPY